MNSIDSRLAYARDACERVAQTALALFNDRDNLNIEQKGLQDWVSNADKTVEEELRRLLQSTFPADAIIGEEHANTDGTSEYTWVIDPIDGTTNFVNGTPGWCVVLACVKGDDCVCGVICDPISKETFTAVKGGGAYVNKRKMRVSQATSLDAGTLAVGHSSRVSALLTINVLSELLQRDGMFRRSGSGAQDLAYVAAGRLIGYVEPHMNAWDCLAALLMIEEAGGIVQTFDMQQMLSHGGRVVASGPGIHEELLAMVQRAYDTQP